MAEKREIRGKSQQSSETITRFMDQCTKFWGEAIETLECCWEQSSTREKLDAGMIDRNDEKASKRETQMPQPQPRRKLNPHI